MNDQNPAAADHQTGSHLLTRDFDRDTLVPLRHDVARLAEHNGLTGLARYRFVVAVNEITTNAVRHGGGRGRIRIWRTGNLLHCQVSDHGPGLPATFRHHTARPPAHATTGRGLWLAQRRCHLTTHSDTRGTTVTLVCPAGPG